MLSVLGEVHMALLDDGPGSETTFVAAQGRSRGCLMTSCRLNFLAYMNPTLTLPDVSALSTTTNKSSLHMRPRHDHSFLKVNQER